MAGGINFDKLREKQSRQSGRGWNPKEGQNMIRILPPSSRYYTEVLNDFAVEFRVHFLKVEGEELRVTRCYRDAGNACPVCEQVRAFKRSEDPGLVKLADGAKAKDRHVLNILDLSNPQAGIQTYETGYMVYNKVLEFAANPMYGDVFNPEAGRNWMLELVPANRSKTGWNNYNVMPDPNLTSVISMLPQNWVQLLDNAQAAVAEYLAEDEVLKTLRMMGFPVSGGGNVTVSTGTGFVAAPSALPGFGAPGVTTPFTATPPNVAPAPTFVQPAAPTVQAPQQPVPVQPAAAQPVQAPQAQQPTGFGFGGTPVAQPVPFPTPAAAPEPVAAPAPSALVAQQPVYPEGLQLRPDGKPVCYGKFDPAQHPCDRGCPIVEKCQLNMLGLGE